MTRPETGPILSSGFEVTIVVPETKTKCVKIYFKLELLIHKMSIELYWSVLEKLNAI